jgi:hypothetical protein
MWGRGQYLQNGDVLASNGLIHGELQILTSRTLKTVKIDKMRGL